MENRAEDSERAQDRRRPEYCYHEHEGIERRVSSLEAENRVIHGKIEYLAKEVNLMSSIMTTIQRNTNESNVANQRTAGQIEAMRAEIKGMSQMIELRHAVEREGGFIPAMRQIGVILGILIQVGAIGGIVWGVIMFAHRSAP